MNHMETYDELRAQYKPAHIRFLLIAESPPPSAEIQSSRQFYRAEKIRHDDRLFVNTIQALYREATDKTEAVLEAEKEQWLQCLKQDGVYMIEALEVSQRHATTKKERQERIGEALPRLTERVRELAEDHTKLILIKSNVFEVAAEPLRQAGFEVLNTKLVDYPGYYNQTAYRQKLGELVRSKGWQES